MSTIFAKIIRRELPAFILAENDRFLAFLDVFPVKDGHVLIVPKTEVDKFFDVSDELLSEWLLFARPIAKAIEKAFPCNRCGLSVVGLEVPHAHMHLLPINTVSDMHFGGPKNKASEEHLQNVQAKILAFL